MLLLHRALVDFLLRHDEHVFLLMEKVRSILLLFFGIVQLKHHATLLLQKILLPLHIADGEYCIPPLPNRAVRLNSQ